MLFLWRHNYIQHQHLTALDNVHCIRPEAFCPSNTNNSSSIVLISKLYLFWSFYPTFHLRWEGKAMARRFRPSCGRCELFSTWNRCSFNFHPLRAGGCGRGSWVRFEVGVWWSCDVTEITLMSTRSLFPDVFSVQSTSSNKFPSWKTNLGKMWARLVRSMIFTARKTWVANRVE